MTEEEKTTVGEENKPEVKAEQPVDELTKMTNSYNEVNDKFLRLYAEFDNFKKRTAKERIDLFKTAGEDILKDMLPVMDDFERALKSMNETSDVKSVKEGVELIYNKFKNIMNQKGVQPLVSMGQTFDADIHEAITNIPAPSDDLKGKVVDEVEKGYSLNGKVIRYAKVIVGN